MVNAKIKIFEQLMIPKSDVNEEEKKLKEEEKRKKKREADRLRYLRNKELLAEKKVSNYETKSSFSYAAISGNGRVFTNF